MSALGTALAAGGLVILSVASLAAALALMVGSVRASHRHWIKVRDGH